MLVSPAAIASRVPWVVAASQSWEDDARRVLSASPRAKLNAALYAVSRERVLMSRATLKTTGRRAIQSVDMKAEHGMVVFCFKRSEEPATASISRPSSGHL